MSRWLDFAQAFSTSASSANPISLNALAEAGIETGIVQYNEIAAIEEFCEGRCREASEITAARVKGFTVPDALFTRAEDCWVIAVNRSRHPLRAEAQRLILGGWAIKAASLGWDEVNLFGAQDGIVAKLQGSTPILLTRDMSRLDDGRVIYRTDTERPEDQPFWRVKGGQSEIS